MTETEQATGATDEQIESAVERYCERVETRTTGLAAMKEARRMMTVSVARDLVPPGERIVPAGEALFVRCGMCQGSREVRTFAGPQSCAKCDGVGFVPVAGGQP